MEKKIFPDGLPGFSVAAEDNTALLQVYCNLYRLDDQTGNIVHPGSTISLAVEDPETDSMIYELSTLWDWGTSMESSVT